MRRMDKTLALLVAVLLPLMIIPPGWSVQFTPSGAPLLTPHQPLPEQTHAQPLPNLTSPPTPGLPTPLEEAEEKLKERTPLAEKSVEGAAFPLPESLRDEVEEYRKAIPEGAPSHAFLLMDREGIRLVLSPGEVSKGYATVRGVEYQARLKIGEREVSVLLAREVSIATEGEPATVREVVTDPGRYRLKLVHVEAALRQGAVLVDPDGEPDVTLPVRVGLLVENPRTVGEVIQNLKETGRALVENPEREKLLKALRESQREHLSIFDFEEGYWTDGRAEVDAIVLHPEDTLRLLAFLPEPARDLLSSENATLYSVEQRLEVTELGSLQEARTRAEELKGRTVAFEAYGIGRSVSVQESLEHGSDCGPDLFQTGQGCVNLPVDVLLEGMVAWDGVPRSREEVLLLVGASSLHQDSPEEEIKGRFRYVGKLVSTKQVDESLPEGLVLVVMGREKVGDFDLEKLLGDVEGMVRSELKVAESLVSYETPAGVHERERPSGEEEEGVVGRVAELPKRALASVVRVSKRILSLLGFG